jgi:WD repeat-containing protein 68
MWIPDKNSTKPDLLATTGDYLRIWQVGDDNKITLKSLLNNVSECALK